MQDTMESEMESDRIGWNVSLSLSKFVYGTREGGKEKLVRPKRIFAIVYQCILYLMSSFISESSPLKSRWTSKSRSLSFLSLGFDAKVPCSSSPFFTVR